MCQSLRTSTPGWALRNYNPQRTSLPRPLGCLLGGRERFTRQSSESWSRGKVEKGARAEALAARTSLPPPPHYLHFLGRCSCYRVRSAANEEAEVTVASQLPAAAWRLKPERIALLEKLVLRISGIAESSGEAESGVKKPAMHPGANGRPPAPHPA